MRTLSRPSMYSIANHARVALWLNRQYITTSSDDSSQSKGINIVHGELSQSCKTGQPFAGDLFGDVFFLIWVDTYENVALQRPTNLRPC